MYMLSICRTDIVMRSCASMAESTAGQSDPPDADETQGRNLFGTFGGVFTPSILTILGVVMYMRFGWVVGQQGLLGALAIVAVAHLISLSTGLSVASIATNRTVGAGGAYFMISRSLGSPAGAAIGIPLFLGQALGVTFYIVGFTEALCGTAAFASLKTPVVLGLTGAQLLGSGVLLALTYLSIRSAALAIKVQYVVMAGIALSLVSFFLGGSAHPPEQVALSNPNGAPFWTVFSVFFPAVTGLMAGVSMSGDLANPREAIPRGTLAAILVGGLVYCAFPVFLALQADTATLASNYRVVWDIARWPVLIDWGVYAATLSSALSSVLTAPRTLQALAQDGHVPALFGRGMGKRGEPVAGLLLTGALAELGILVGDLNAIAPVLTMFFLVTYGFTNLACGLERWAASPSFRPDFKVPAWVSLLGALSCFYVMSIIDMGAMLLALSVCGALFIVSQRRVFNTTFGDARHGIWAALVRSALHRMRRAGFHPQNWRPNLLILGGDPDKRTYLLRLGSAVVQDRGIVSYAHLLKGEVTEQAARRKALLKTLGTQIAEEFPNVFYRVDVVDDIYRGVVTLAQGYGVGGLEANTVMLGFPSKETRRVSFVRTLRELSALDKSVLLVHPASRTQVRRQRNPLPQIHIWWGGMDKNGGLMLLIAFLLTAGRTLQGAQVTVLTAVNSDSEAKEAPVALGRILDAARLPARARVIPRDGRPIAELMAEHSGQADLAILGIGMPKYDEQGADEFFERMQPMLNVLPTTVMVHSARNFRGEPVLFGEDHQPANQAVSQPADQPEKAPPAAVAPSTANAVAGGSSEL